MQARNLEFPNLVSSVSVNLYFTYELILGLFNMFCMNISMNISMNIGDMTIKQECRLQQMGGVFELSAILV